MTDIHINVFNAKLCDEKDNVRIPQELISRIDGWAVNIDQVADDVSKQTLRPAI